MHAMIIAAGTGSRLKPFTDECPKPLVQCGPRRLIEYKLEALVSAGIRRVIINISYRGWLFKQILGDGQRYGCEITYIEEPYQEPLGVIGGITNALPELSDPFFLTSADTVSDVDLDALLRCWDESGSDAMLMMVPNPSHHPRGDFSVCRNRICDDGEGQRMCYGGMAVFTQSWFHRYRDAAGLRSLIDRGRAEGLHATVHQHHGTWFNVDTYARWEAADQWLQNHMAAGVR